MQPCFLSGQAGPLFALYWTPSQSKPEQAFLHVPAFAEEMNKSRRMVALQAKALADQGVAVLVLDLFGTGDSGGDFAEASWECWLADVASGVAWLKERGIAQVNLWGLRTGALLALDFAQRNPGEIERLLLWQPVLNGDTFVTQFLRLRVAAAIMNSNMPKEKTSDLKRQLLAGQTIEVAGYLLNPDLIKPLMLLRADCLTLPNVKEVALFEVVANEDTQVSMSSSQFFGMLQEKRIKASLTKIIGDSFWASQEISEAPELIKMSSIQVEQWL